MKIIDKLRKYIFQDLLNVYSAMTPDRSNLFRFPIATHRIQTIMHMQILDDLNGNKSTIDVNVPVFLEFCPPREIFIQQDISQIRFFINEVLKETTDVFNITK